MAAWSVQRCPAQRPSRSAGRRRPCHPRRGQSFRKKRQDNQLSRNGRVALCRPNETLSPSLRPWRSRQTLVRPGLADLIWDMEDIEKMHRADMVGKQSGYGGQTKPIFHKKAKTVCFCFYLAFAPLCFLSQGAACYRASAFGRGESLQAYKQEQKLSSSTRVQKLTTFTDQEGRAPSRVHRLQGQAPAHLEAMQAL